MRYRDDGRLILTAPMVHWTKHATEKDMIRCAPFVEQWTQSLRNVFSPGWHGWLKIWPITSSSPRNQRSALELIGEYFRREFGYDFAAYCAAEDTDRDQVFALVLDDSRFARMVGGIGFCFGKDARGGLSSHGRGCIHTSGVTAFCRHFGLISASITEISTCNGPYRQRWRNS